MVTRVTYRDIVRSYSLLAALDSRVSDEMKVETKVDVDFELETVSYTDHKDHWVSTTVY